MENLGRFCDITSKNETEFSGCPGNMVMWNLQIETCRNIPQKHLFEWVYQEEFFNKTDAFLERLQQLLINKINI